MKESKAWEFGDFQTPPALAEQAVRYLRDADPEFSPGTVLEPTCGVGAFLLAAADVFPNASTLLGIEIEANYLAELEKKVSHRPNAKRFNLQQGNFFEMDWEAILANLPEPILVVGNPPWVTSSDLGRLRGSNLPEKTNAQKYSGIDAVTGKSNFDISEWMLERHVEWLSTRKGYIAVLCKVAVARKILRQMWKSKNTCMESRMVQIDARKHFGAAVDACFFTIKSNAVESKKLCKFFPNFNAAHPCQVFEFHRNILVADSSAFHKHRDVLGTDPNYTWRSGIKHDCAKVMELHRDGHRLVNGFDEAVDLEEDFVFPLLKSSDVGNGRLFSARMNMIVPQSKVGQDTRPIKSCAPKTWAYLQKHATRLDGRKSTVYQGQPRFSVFGIGDYTFTDWKIAISGFYKRIKFCVVGPMDGKPVVFDDTVYFLNMNSREEAEFIAELFNSEMAKTFLESMILWSDKRPITSELLKRVHVRKLAEKLGQGGHYARLHHPLIAA